MNVLDIQPVITCNYIIAVDLGFLLEQIESYDRRYSLNLNPDFQRDLVWPLSTKIKFVEYVLKGGTIPPIVFNSPIFGGHGSKGDLPDEMVIVDGKQRLNALVEFLNGKLPVFGGHYVGDLIGINNLLRQVTVQFKVNHIDTKNELLQWYLEMNEGQIAHTKSELDKVRAMMK